MKVFVLGLDGATWDILRPLAEAGELAEPGPADGRGGVGDAELGLPAAQPGGLDRGDDGQELGQARRSSSSWSTRTTRWAGGSTRRGRSRPSWSGRSPGGTARRPWPGGVPMSYPPRQAPGFYLGDFLSPRRRARLRQRPGDLRRAGAGPRRPYRPWSTAVHDGGREAEALAELTDFLDHHLKAVRFLMGRCPWDLFMFDLMATDRIQHELWHAWDPDAPRGAGAATSRPSARGSSSSGRGSTTASARSRRRCRPTRPWS